MFILRETITAIRRTPLMSAMTSFVIAIALAVIGVFGIIIIRAHDTLTEFRSKLVIEAFFAAKLSSAEAQQIANESLKTLPSLASYRFVTREEALRNYEMESGENVTEAIGYNPLPASAQMTFTDLTSETARSLEQTITHVNGIEKVSVDHRTLEELENRQRGLIILALGIGGLLLAASLVIVVATIRLAIHARRDAVRTMRLLGATRTTIITPFIFEGMLAGLLGAIFGVALSHAIVTYGLPMLMPDMVITLTMRQEYIVLASGILITGISLAGIGSLLTAIAYIRKTR